MLNTVMNNLIISAWKSKVFLDWYSIHDSTPAVGGLTEAVELFSFYLFMEKQQEKPQFVKTSKFLSCEHVARHKTISLSYSKCCYVIRFPSGPGHICPSQSIHSQSHFNVNRTKLKILLRSITVTCYSFKPLNVIRSIIVKLYSSYRYSFNSVYEKR